MHCKTSNTSLVGSIHCLFRYSGSILWLHFVYIWPWKTWIFWIWNIILIHFSFNNMSLPLHVAHAHQKWFCIDFDQICKIWQDFFLDAANNFCFTFLQTYQISNWWLISGLSSRILIWIVRSVVIWEITYISYFLQVHWLLL